MQSGHQNFGTDEWRGSPGPHGSRHPSAAVARHDDQSACSPSGRGASASVRRNASTVFVVMASAVADVESGVVRLSASTEVVVLLEDDE